jgi:hypothetical protein
MKKVVNHSSNILTRMQSFSFLKSKSKTKIPEFNVGESQPCMLVYNNKGIKMI